MSIQCVCAVREMVDFIALRIGATSQQENQNEVNKRKILRFKCL